MPIVVASAAPFSPMLSGKMKTASRTMLIKHPVTVATIAVFGEPSARIKGTKALERTEKGRPMMIQKAYSLEAARDSGVFAPKKERT